MEIRRRKISFQVIFLFITFFLDGIIKWSFFDNINKGTFFVVPQLMLMALTMLCLRMDDTRLIIIYGVIFGLSYDFYYSGLIGIYTVLIPVILYGIDHYKYLFASSDFIYEISVYFIVLVVLQTFVYLLERLFQQTTTDFLDYVTFTLGPTLLFNIVMFFILYVIMARICDWLVKYRRESR
ncbi:rod shape-determining protein MreD [Companilactobacillus metriopterae]|uniref:rod shape-determining protein MreD n=1 Tax=Companilactobacillus metriopterae TaxID=1909267 RepID=UPI00100BE757|nr:rod shape-determining protein MreD [Companilactobacillus metriopterae]